MPSIEAIEAIGTRRRSKVDNLNASSQQTPSSTEPEAGELKQKYAPKRYTLRKAQAQPTDGREAAGSKNKKLPKTPPKKANEADSTPPRTFLKSSETQSRSPQPFGRKPKRQISEAGRQEILRRYNEKCGLSPETHSIKSLSPSEKILRGTHPWFL